MTKNLIALKTIVTKEITRFMRIWTQTLLPPAITMTLYFIIFGHLIGSQLRDVHGYSYMQFIVPGLTMMTIMTNAYANTSSSFFGAKFSRSVEEMLVSSMPGYLIMIGYMIGGALRGLLTGTIVLLVSMLFTHLHVHNLGIVLLMAVLASLLFSLGGFINAIFAKKFDDVSFVPTFILTPLTYLGGVFYSVQQLPAMWQSVSTLNPILNIVDTFRYGMLGISDISPYRGFLLISLLFLIMIVWCMMLLRKGTGLRS
ncbi:MAG: ABC transporter permease [Gammaproteobacteria bacterium]|nr:ABC transporter permease [Gammaproteobacteria bacterium]